MQVRDNWKARVRPQQACHTFHSTVSAGQYTPATFIVARSTVSQSMLDQTDKSAVQCKPCWLYLVSMVIDCLWANLHKITEWQQLAKVKDKLEIEFTWPNARFVCVKLSQ